MMASDVALTFVRCGRACVGVVAWDVGVPDRCVLCLFDVSAVSCRRVRFYSESPALSRMRALRVGCRSRWSDKREVGSCERPEVARWVARVSTGRHASDGFSFCRYFSAVRPKRA